MSKRDRIYMVISHILVIAWMVVIFSFSAQPGEESADLSGGVSHLFMLIVNKLFGFGWDEAQVLAMTELWDYPIRKLAHMTEFGILAVLIFVAVKYYKKINTAKRRFFAAWIATICYAATDEVHQIFVPARDGNLFDVCVDASGALIALTLVFVASRLVARIRIRK